MTTQWTGLQVVLVVEPETGAQGRHQGHGALVDDFGQVTAVTDVGVTAANPMEQVDQAQDQRPA